MTRIEDCQQQQKAPLIWYQKLQFCPVLAEKNSLQEDGFEEKNVFNIFLFTSGWDTLPNVKRIWTSVLICVFLLLGRAGQTCVWGFVVLFGKAALNRGKKGGMEGGREGVERPQFHFFTRIPLSFSLDLTFTWSDMSIVYAVGGLYRWCPINIIRNRQLFRFGVFLPILSINANKNIINNSFLWSLFITRSLDMLEKEQSEYVLSSWFNAGQR